MAKASAPVARASTIPVTRSSNAKASSELDSRVSLSSCNSVQIHRSALPVEAFHDKGDSEVSATDNHPGLPTESLSGARLAEAASAIRHVLSNLEDADSNTPIKPQVCWTTPRRQDLEAPLILEPPGSGDCESQPTGPPAQPDTHRRRPFHKWVQTLNRRRGERRRLRRLDASEQTRASNISDGPIGCSGPRRQSSSISSFAYVSAVRDASISGASASIVGSSRKQRARSSKRLSKTDRSSHASYSFRYSEDDRPQSHADPTVLERSKHRRRILEELIETEEGYIGDIKFLTKAYLTIFAPSTSVDPGLRRSMHSSLTDIVELHDQLLGELHAAVPYSEYAGMPPVSSIQAQRQLRSLDAVPEDKTKGLPIHGHSNLVADPQTAAAVACVFAQNMDRFLIYHEYGAKFGMVIDDLKRIHRSNPHWDRQQKGLEAMASYLSYTRDPAANKKALSIEDLLAKPIQRVCRYPLLLKELLKATPVFDCPRAHLYIENVYSELENVARTMNEAIDDPIFKSVVQKTWLLQDRLQFPNKRISKIPKSHIRAFGRIELCGIVYVCWQTKCSVEGSYMIALLYQHWLCLAVAEKSETSYTLQACIMLDKCSLEEADNGRGLQCHSSPFTWKMVFDCNGQLHDMLMTTNTRTEERVWRQKLKTDWRETSSNQPLPDAQAFEFLDLNMKSLGQGFEANKTQNGRPAMRRTKTALPPKTPPCQVILKITRVGREFSQEASKHATINRHMSLQDNIRTFILAPSRGERTHLESQIWDVWTRDILFCIGSAAHAGGGHHKRPSATSMMRKISVTSITSTFGRRSISRSPSHKTAGKADHSSPGHAAVLPPLLPEVDLAIKAGLRQILSKRHGKTGPIDVTVREQGSTDASTSLDGEREQLYALTGSAERAGGLQSRDIGLISPAPSASVPRYSMTRFIEEIGYGRANRNNEANSNAHARERSVPSSPVPRLCHLDTCPPSTVQLSVTNSAVQLMTPLAPQPAASASARQPRHWLGRSLLHRRSLHRPQRAATNTPS